MHPDVFTAAALEKTWVICTEKSENYSAVQMDLETGDEKEL